MLGNVAEDQIGGNGRDLIEAGLGEFALNVIFAGESKPAMELDAGIAGFP